MTRGLLLGSVLVAIMLAGTAFAQSPSQTRFDHLEDRVTRMESEVDDLASAGFVMLLFGAFCALWAQNSSRDAWLWFFLGLLFNVITVVVLLSKNSADVKVRRTSAIDS